MTYVNIIKKMPALIILLMASSGGLLLSGCKGGQSSAPPISEVSVSKIEPQELALSIELPGRTSAYRVAEIRPQVSGLIEKRVFEEGSDVKEDQLLYQIEPAPFQAALDTAAASLSKAEAHLPAVRQKLARYKELLAKKAVSQQDYDDIEAATKQSVADVALAKAAVDTAKINLGYTRVSAPISGRIGRSSVTDGALVTAHQAMPLATVQQLDPMYVDIPQSTTALLKLRRNLEDGRLNKDAANQNKVKLILEDGTPYECEGVLQFQDVSVDETTGSVILRAVFPNPKGVLLPGMFVRAFVKEGVDAQAILVAQQALLRDPKGNPYVLIVDAEEKVQQRMLTLDRAIGGDWRVSSGLQAGDRVIVENVQKVRPGSLVKAMAFESSRIVATPSGSPTARTN